ncbi:MAG: phosphoenolpyruvate--protein phosphotransferase [Candidatus Omnitrophota bacterium]|nr:MAG: phosphoenolpyruvate--protein phosphotransferase [Candidatus Omnitrophota bacterium]
MVLKGIAVSPGIVIGKAFLLNSDSFVIPRVKIKEEEVFREIERFKKALEQTRQEIINLQRKLNREVDSKHSEIFNAHLLILDDPVLTQQMIEKIKKKMLNAEYLFQQLIKNYEKAFLKIDDAYFKERISDIRDVGKRVIRNLLGRKKMNLDSVKEEVIVVSYDLSPSDTALMRKEKVIGFATDIGGRTSHTAIMARSLKIPAVVGLEKISAKTKNDDLLIIDGNKGIVVINPRPEVIERYRKKKEEEKIARQELEKIRELPAQTCDGEKVEISANIELPEEIDSALKEGAEGIGLYRTEYFFLNRSRLPTEEEQYRAYKFVAQRMKPYPVVIRTLDLGGDKFLSHLNIPAEMNPFLGWRAIRFCLARPDIFKTQLKAILRASKYGNLKIMYPMICSVEEFRQANEVLEEVKKELKREGISFDKNIEVGAMIEIPSAALTADILAKEADFFSIGTNDLIQYSLAVDRVNEKIAYLYEPNHPAILRLIKMVIDAAHKEGIWVGMCGEMCSEPIFIPLLLGLGLTKFSVSPLMLLRIKKVVRSISLSKAREMAKQILSLSSIKEIKRFSRLKFKQIV